MVTFIPVSSASSEYSSSITDGYTQAPTVLISYVGSMSASSSIDDGYLASGAINTASTGTLTTLSITYYFVACNDTGFGRRSWVSLSSVASSAITVAPTPTGTYDQTSFVVLSSWAILTAS